MNRNKPSTLQALTRRERDIIDALYKLGEGTVGQVQAALLQKATYSTVRAHSALSSERDTCFTENGTSGMYTYLWYLSNGRLSQIYTVLMKRSLMTQSKSYYLHCSPKWHREGSKACSVM